MSINKKLFSVLICLSGFVSFTYSQEYTLFEKHWFIQNGDTLPFRLLMPENYNAENKYPVILFLHGRGESGKDNEKQLIHGARLFSADSIRKRYPAIVILPQCPANDYWSNVQMLAEGKSTGKRSFHFVSDGPASGSMQLTMALIDNILKRFPVNTRQIYVMGLSMGGMGTFEIVRRKPGFFAAAVPICGGADPASAAKLRGSAWWVFHGAKDDVVLPDYSIRMVNAMKQNKVSVRFTLYPEANHNSWDAAFKEENLFSWMFSNKLAHLNTR